MHIIVRHLMQQRGIAIGKPQSVKFAYAFLTIWGITAVVTIILANVL